MGYAALVAAAMVCSASAALPAPGSASLGNMRLRGGVEISMTRSASQQDISNPNVKRPGPPTSDPKKNKIWSLSQQYKPADKLSIQKSVVHHAEHTLATDRYNFDDGTAYQAVALSVRDHLVESLRDTKAHYLKEDPKRVYYLSLEFLMGRSLLNSLMNLDLEKPYKEALEEIGYKLEDMVEQEKDAALGNGGLGRLAACFLDSMATLNLPAWGYGIRYEHGMFEQRFKDGNQVPFPPPLLGTAPLQPPARLRLQGWTERRPQVLTLARLLLLTVVRAKQVEFPDTWLTKGNPWEVQRLDISYPVMFYGSEKVMAVAYDVPIPGYDTLNTNSLRLWSAMPDHDIDLAKFNDGDYNTALKARQNALEITQAPSRKNTLKHDMLTMLTAIYSNTKHADTPLPVQVLYPNDNNQAGKELRLKQQYFFVSATMQVLPEALEKWSVELMGNLLPRITEIIFEINRRWLGEVKEIYGDNYDKMNSLSIVEGDGEHKMFRMAHLAILSGMAPPPPLPHFSGSQGITDKFIGITNGVTCRRWLAQCNPTLNTLITKTLGSDKWIRNLDLLDGLKKFADNDKVLDELAASKLANKKRLATYLKERQGIDVDVNTMFDIQVKRIHEYKRQLLNVFRIIHQYDRIKKMSPAERAKVVPRTVMIGGKAAAGYFVAKKILSLANAVGRVLEADADTNKYLRLVVIENYKVSNAQVIIPANDISEHISTAGTEASGTSNMKFVMNGGLIIGTDDGANIEIKECVKEENIFIFGAKCPEIADATRRMREGAPWDARLTNVFSMIRSGKFGNPADFEPVLNSIEDGRDRYLLAHDFASYLECQDKVDVEYKKTREWNQKCLNAVAGMGWYFPTPKINPS
ncbi:hypothetical protein T484DRAFT_1744944 [Baffinella frigidus]|nr:hypothetical protein T484DRAFT_1744944 [Cryptophyta sp. CCMP2293]